MTAVTIKQGPIWLKAGDQIQFKVMPVNNSNWPGNNSWDFSLSIIEYNIVP
jgi:hypothetical protein